MSKGWIHLYAVPAARKTLQWSGLSFRSWRSGLSGTCSVYPASSERAGYRVKTGTQTLTVTRIHWSQSWHNSQPERNNLFLCWCLASSPKCRALGAFPLWNLSQILRHTEFQYQLLHTPAPHLRLSPELRGFCTHSQCLSCTAKRSNPGSM